MLESDVLAHHLAVGARKHKLARRGLNGLLQPRDQPIRYWEDVGVAALRGVPSPAALHHKFPAIQVNVRFSEAQGFTAPEAEVDRRGEERPPPRGKRLHDWADLFGP